MRVISEPTKPLPVQHVECSGCGAGLEYYASDVCYVPARPWDWSAPRFVTCPICGERTTVKWEED